MTVKRSAVPSQIQTATISDDSNPRPLKRTRFAVDDTDEPRPSKDFRSKNLSKDEASSLHRPHPLGIKPSGNALLYPTLALSTRIGGLGNLSRLPDELILETLSGLPPITLFMIQAISRALFAFSRYQSLWKTLLLTRSEGRLNRWDGDWRRTYFALYLAQEGNIEGLYADAGDEEMQEDLVLPADGILVPGLCSDVLYQPHLCAAPLTHHFLTRSGVETLSNLGRIDARNMAPMEFAEKYARTSTPVLLTGLMDDWPAMQKNTSSSWALPSLVRRFPDNEFRAEAALAPISTYAKYCTSIQRDEGMVDESPLYLFDSEFVGRSGGAMGAEFEVPRLFGEDLFRVMGGERPDYRWLIIGPSRAGSSWHKDPNATSAWNAVITGSKGWILLPPNITPPGVFVSEDEAEITSPLSLAEWFESYYAHTLSEYGPHAKDPVKRGKLVQGVCRAGEVMYIPAGWWHLVVNLEECVALTQNFVSATELPNVLRFLRDRPAQVSGFKLRASSVSSASEGDEGVVNAEVYERFVSALQREAPELLGEAMGVLENEDRQIAREKGKKEGSAGVGMWEALKKVEGGAGCGFVLDVEGDELGDIPW